MCVCVGSGGEISGQCSDVMIWWRGCVGESWLIIWALLLFSRVLV